MMIIKHSVVGSEAESGESHFIPLTTQTHFLSHSLVAVQIVAQAVRLADDGKLPTSVFQQLTARDISKLSSLMKVPYVQGSEAYCDELETMLEDGWKMELGEGIVCLLISFFLCFLLTIIDTTEALSWVGVDYLSEEVRKGYMSTSHEKIVLTLLVHGTAASLVQWLLETILNGDYI